MAATTLPELVTLLRGPTLTVRTGIWLAPPSAFGREQDEAARLGIDAVDIRDPIWADLPKDTRFLELTSARMIEALEAICRGPRVSDCVLVYNFDLPLARLPGQARQQLWDQLLTGFPHRVCGLLLMMPQHAHALLPSQMELKWRNDNRLAS